MLVCIYTFDSDYFLVVGGCEFDEEMATLLVLVFVVLRDDAV